MFVKTDRERAASEAAKVRDDARSASTSATSGARNLGAAVLATLAEVTAAKDDSKGRAQAHKTRERALQAAEADRAAVKEAVSTAAHHARSTADHGKAALGERTEEVRGRAAEFAGTTRERADVWRERATEAAAPRTEAIRDVVNKDIMPRLQTMIEEAQARTAAASSLGAAALVDHTPLPEPKKKRKGKVLIVVGLLAAAGAGVAWYLSRQQPAEDPWATDLPAAEDATDETIVSDEEKSETGSGI